MNDYSIWGSLIQHKHWEEAQTQARKAHLASVRARLQLQQRVERLEEELEWAGLIASALAAHCIEKGLMTDADLKDRIAKIEADRAAAQKAAEETAAAAAAAAAAPPESKRTRRLLRRGRLPRRPRD